MRDSSPSFVRLRPDERDGSFSGSEWEGGRAWSFSLHSVLGSDRSSSTWISGCFKHPIVRFTSLGQLRVLSPRGIFLKDVPFPCLALGKLRVIDLRRRLSMRSPGKCA